MTTPLTTRGRLHSQGMDQPSMSVSNPAPPYRVTVLGATGSIGTNTLDLIARAPECFEVIALTANRNVEALANLARRHNARCAVINDETRYQDLKDALADTQVEVSAGPDAVENAAQRPADCVIAAIVGAAGLRPTFASLTQGRRLGLANKECLVSAGSVFMAEANAHGVEILPVDSEHSAAFQALNGVDPQTIERITLTASGGPFRDWTLERINSATLDEALAHPNWSMGKKVTIDSATMMNKGLELIEAFHLFPVDADKLDAVVHPQSIVHCLVSFTDGSVIAQLAEPDMRTPISLALAWPTRMTTPTKRLDLTQIKQLSFEPLDERRFPALRLAREALSVGASAPTVLNAANEIAVEAFLAGKIRFPDICRTVETTIETAHKTGLIAPMTSLDDVLNIDSEARQLAGAAISPLC